jgi:hypothetical protein
LPQLPSLHVLPLLLLLRLCLWLMPGGAEDGRL